MKRAGLVGACALASIVIAEAVILRVAGPGGASLTERVFAVLVAAALLIVAVLALPRAGALAWASVTAAAAVGVVETVTVVRSVETVTTGSAWVRLAALAGLGLVAGATIAAAYAGRHWTSAPRAGRLAFALVAGGSVATVVASVAAVAAAGAPAVAPPAAGELTALRVAVRIGLATIAGGFLVGLATDLGGPAIRAYRRWRGERDKHPERRLWRLVELLVDELMPNRAAERQRAVEAERARLAADLHALVIPELRHAAAAAQAAGLPAEAQVDLRRALEDVEQLMHERQSIVLEEFGLVAALEWLAERTQERSRLRVELELEGDVPDRPDAVDPTVARAAFRIALLALDNVVRHAGATAATIRLTAEPATLRLLVVDDGTAGDGSDSRNGRGLADMREAASASGGSIEIALGDRSSVSVAWPPPSRGR